jgi:hypothetical protein
MRGQGQGNFLSGLEAVAQVVSTTLKLLTGEWWADLSVGTPVFQSILGVPNTNAGVALILRQRILSVPYVTDIQNLIVTYSVGREYTFSANVFTVFGTLQITTQPLPGLQAQL